MGMKTGSLLVGAGFLLGTVGVKALTSQQAKRCYVQSAAYALRARQYYEEVVEQAKAEVDDIIAEAEYINTQAAAEEAVEVAPESIPEPTKEETKKPRKKTAAKPAQ